MDMYWKLWKLWKCLWKLYVFICVYYGIVIATLQTCYTTLPPLRRPKGSRSSSTPEVRVGRMPRLDPVNVAKRGTTILCFTSKSWGFPDYQRVETFFPHRKAGFWFEHLLTSPILFIAGKIIEFERVWLPTSHGYLSRGSHSRYT